MSEQVSLKRSLGLVGLTLYGVGDMLGSGIYALVGKAAGVMGNAIWLGFACSAVAAMLTGLTYASLGSRYPKAAGAPYVSFRAFGFPMLSYVLGLVIMASGLTSMATATHGVANYAMQILGQPGDSLGRWGIIAVFLLVVTAINFRGISESAWVNAVCTLVEVAGLGLVIAVGFRYWGSVNYLETPLSATGATGAGTHIPLSPGLLLTGAVLTFYSFVGFEDMLNVSEEVKNPARTFPLGLILSLLIATAIYMAVAITVVSVVPYEVLGKSTAPMTDVVKAAAPWFPPVMFTAISIFAISNTALLNYVMGSRLVYGMAKQGLLPAVLGRVHKGRQTPHVAIGVLLVIVSVLVGVGNLQTLATATSLLLLGAFIVVNGSWIILRRKAGEPRGGFEVHWIVPVLGILVCGTLIGMQVLNVFSVDAQKAEDARWSMVIAVGIVGGVACLYGVHRPKVVEEDGEGLGEAAREV